MFYFLRTYTCTNGPADISYASLCTSCDSFRLRMFEFDFQIWQVETEKYNKTWACNRIGSSRVLSMRRKKRKDRSSYLSSSHEAEPEVCSHILSLEDMQ